ncbi:hypothetical protein QRX60_31000 [Amycolatopsis mongoliensis]|uniref:ABC transporter permease n=1 Tax=Amycolatopsis mongoliensis TaxID=715475 RepID=A0A9Y2JJL4_9PSEU|nr:hypothetical protein [Amycolatopsis sp. 4-36]WIX98481.1 hypothetical protein QRX60_31000 [Amycolatopsis sp. 4-36]
MTLVKLMVRRHRMLLTSWLLLMIALSGGTVSAYQSTYPTEAQRRLAVQLAQHNAATTLLYGNLPDPGTPALMFAWEIGAIATILAAIMGVLVAIALTRAAEDEGTLELVRGSGVAPPVPLRSALLVLGMVAAVLALGCAFAVGLSAGHVDAVTWPGAVAFGSVVGLTFLLAGTLAAVLAQVAPTATGARTLGFAAVGVAFAVRTLADTRHVGWLNWLTPLGLRATVRPFAQERWWVFATGLFAAAVLAWLALVLSARREYGAGLITRRDMRGTRLNIRSGFALAGRLARRQVLTWTVAVACVGTLFSAMGSGVVRQSENGDLGGFLGSQLGTGDPVAAYFAYSGTVVGMVVSSFAVLSVLTSRHDEARGLTDHVLATGARRWTPLAAQAAVTAVGSLLILTATGTLSALIAPAVIDGSDVAVHAFTYVVGQWPAMLAVTGWAALLVGLRPRVSWPAWIPLVAGGTFALLGGLLGIPQPVRDLGVFQHVPDVVSPDPDFRGLLVLIAFAGGAFLLGVFGSNRRDLTTG